MFLMDNIISQPPASANESSQGGNQAVLETMEQLKVKSEKEEIDVPQPPQPSATSPQTSVDITQEPRGVENDCQDSLCELVIAENDDSPMPTIDQFVDCAADEKEGQKKELSAELKLKTSRAAQSTQPQVSDQATLEQGNETQPAIKVVKELRQSTAAETAEVKVACKPAEKSSMPFILPKPVIESNVERVPPVLLPLGTPPSDQELPKSAGTVPKKTKVVALPGINKPIAKKAVKPKLTAQKIGDCGSKKTALSMIVNHMDCVTTSKAPPKPRKKPTPKPKKANEKINCGMQSPEQKGNNSSLSTSNTNSNATNNLMMATGMQNMIFPNQLSLAPNGNFIAMPSYMQMPSSQPNGQPQFIPVMSSQIFLAMQQQQQQSETNFVQASSSNLMGSKAPGMSVMQQPSHSSDGNSAVNACSSTASSVVQQAQLMSTSSSGNQMFFRLTSKNGMLMPTLVTPQNMTQVRTSCSTALPMHLNPASGTFFNQPQQQLQQQKFIQPKQVVSTSTNVQMNHRQNTSNDKLQNTSPSNNTTVLASQLVKQQQMATPSTYNQQPVFTTQAHQSQQLTRPNNSQLAASLQGSSGMPRLVQITPSPISGSSLGNMANQQQHQQLQNAWGIANFSMASSHPSCSSTQAMMPSLSSSSIFPQMTVPVLAEDRQLPAMQKARRKRKPGSGGEEEAPESANCETTNDEEENEPPPLLCRDEFGKIENVFLREAALMHERCFDANGNKKTPIKHVIGGFVIEEDLDPFPCEHKQLLDVLTGYQSVEEEEELEEEQSKPLANSSLDTDLPSISRHPPQVDVDNEANDEDDSDEQSYSTEKKKKIRKKKSELESDRRTSEKHSSPTPKPSKKRIISSSSSRAATPVVSKKAVPADKKVKRRRELESLLTMDFGPGKTPFQTTSVDEYTDEVRQDTLKQQRNLAACDERLDRRSSESSSHTTCLPAPSPSKVAKPKPVGRPPRILSPNQKEESIFPNKPSTSTHKKVAQPVESRAEVGVTGPTQADYEEIQEQDEQALLWGDERCIYCKRTFRELGKRHQENPQYCSKTCRRKFKKQKCASSLGLTDSSTDKQSGSSVGLPYSSRGRINIDSLAAKQSHSAPQITVHGSSAFSATTGSPTSLKIKLRSPTEDRPNEPFEMQQVLQQSRTNNFMRGRNDTAEFRNESSQEVLSYSTGGVSGGNGLVSGAQGYGQRSSTHEHLPHQLMMSLVDWPAPKNQVSNLATGQHPQLYHFTPHHPSITPEAVNYQRNSPVPPTSGPVSFPLASLTTSPAPSSATPISVERTTELEMLMARGVHSWGPADVARWVNIVTNSDTHGERFLQQEVDGVALCYLTLPNLQNDLNFKLGPAVKLFSSINALRAITPALGD